MTASSDLAGGRVRAGDRQGKPPSPCVHLIPGLSHHPQVRRDQRDRGLVAGGELGCVPDPDRGTAFSPVRRAADDQQVIDGAKGAGLEPDGNGPRVRAEHRDRVSGEEGGEQGRAVPVLQQVPPPPVAYGGAASGPDDCPVTGSGYCLTRVPAIWLQPGRRQQDHPDQLGRVFWASRPGGWAGQPGPTVRAASGCSAVQVRRTPRPGRLGVRGPRAAARRRRAVRPGLLS
jgi:hypothetical protein